MECLFCNIVKKEIESYIIYEDEKILCILDKFPKKENPGHSLIIIKEHKENIYDYNFDYNLFEKINKISNLLKEKLQFSGLKLVCNNGKSAGQEIMHTHIHLIPFYEKLEEKNLDDVYEKIMK